jgi:hypothetical protein
MKAEKFGSSLIYASISTPFDVQPGTVLGCAGQSQNAKHPPARYSEIGCRIPREYFWVIGWGESNVGIETGSYDAALHMAGIENYHWPPKLAPWRGREQQPRAARL